MKYARILDDTVVEILTLDEHIESRVVQGLVALRPLIHSAPPAYNGATQKLQDRFVVKEAEVSVEYDVVPLFTDVDTCKSVVTGLVGHWRDEALLGEVEVHGRLWQTNSRSKDLLSGAITLANAGGQLPPVWRDATNSNMVITDVGELIAIAAAMAQSIQVAYARSWQLEEFIQTLPDTEDTIDTLCKLTWDTQLPS